MTDQDILISGYIDGQLSAADMARVEELIAADPALAKRVAQLSTTTALLRTACAEAFYPGASILADKPAQLRPPPRRMPAISRRQYLAAAAMASLAVFGTTTYWARTRSDQHDHARHAANAFEEILDKLAAQHPTTTFNSRRLIDHRPDQTQEFFTRFAADSHRNNMPLEAPDLRHFGLHFIGGALLRVQGAPVADLLYDGGSGTPVGILLLACSMPTRPYEFVTRGNLRIVHWCSGEHLIATIGELGKEATMDIARVAAEKLNS